MNYLPLTLMVTLTTCAVATSGEAGEPSPALRSRTDPALDYPIRVVEAEPFWRLAEDKALTIADGLFRAEHRPVDTLRAERVRLPTPNATWKLTGRVGRLEDGTIVAGFGAYLYWSRDEGRSWKGRSITNLPCTKGPVNLRAFGVAANQIFLSHDFTALPQLDVPDRQAYPVGVSRSDDLGATWSNSGPLEVPSPYTFLAGDGNHIVSLSDGTLIAALDAANHRVEPFQAGWLAQVFFRSRNGDGRWGNERWPTNRTWLYPSSHSLEACVHSSLTRVLRIATPVQGVDGELAIFSTAYRPSICRLERLAICRSDPFHRRLRCPIGLEKSLLQEVGRQQLILILAFVVSDHGRMGEGGRHVLRVVGDVGFRVRGDLAHCVGVLWCPEGSDVIGDVDRLAVACGEPREEIRVELLRRRLNGDGVDER